MVGNREPESVSKSDLKMRVAQKKRAAEWNEERESCKGGLAGLVRRPSNWRFSGTSSWAASAVLNALGRDKAWGGTKSLKRLR